MCNCNTTNCKCETYSGKCVKYTGVNINAPFTFTTNSTFNDFVIAVTSYLSQIAPTIKTLTIATVPSGAIVTMNGVTTNSISAPSGTTVDVEVSLAGYAPIVSTYVVGFIDQTITLNLVPIGENVIVTLSSVPPGATILVDGTVTTTIVGLPGSTVVISANLSGYQPYFESYTIPSVNGTHQLNLVPIPQDTFKYYWGEIGNIFAPNPSGITESNWDNQIKPNGTSDNMDEITASSLLTSYNKDSTGNPLQWWIMLVPSSETEAAQSLPNYTWFIWDSINSAWVPFTEHVPYTGTVTLDGVMYTYTSIRPNVSDRIRFSL